VLYEGWGEVLCGVNGTVTSRHSYVDSEEISGILILVVIFANKNKRSAPVLKQAFMNGVNITFRSHIDFTFPM
jgi:hypothetical protein